MPKFRRQQSERLVTASTIGFKIVDIEYFWNSKEGGQSWKYRVKGKSYKAVLGG